MGQTMRKQSQNLLPKAQVFNSNPPNQTKTEDDIFYCNFGHEKTQKP